MYHYFFGIHYRPHGNNEWSFEPLTVNQASARITRDQIATFYQAAKSEYDSSSRTPLNLANYNQTENAEVTFSSRRFHAIEILSKAAEGLSEEGLLKLSIPSTQYNMALRALGKLSDRVQSQNLRNEIEDSMRQAKALSEDAVSVRVRASAILGVIGSCADALRMAEGDPLIRELAFGFLNRVIKNTKLSLLMEIDGYTAEGVRNAVRDIAYSYYDDGIAGKIQRLGPERIKFIQWTLREPALDERTRLAAQNLVRRMVETNQTGPIPLLNKSEVEELYLKLATRIGIQPEKPRLYEHGFFIMETYGMQSEVSPYLVLADKEAGRLGIEFVDWAQADKSTMRMTKSLLDRFRR